MGNENHIRFLIHTDIDKAKWDACIDKSENGLIYAYSFYLDCMARHWDGLVLNDYEAVMPLTWNRKYGISYLYQPFLTAQLGLFGNHLSADLLERFLKQIPARFRYWDFYLNYANRAELQHFKLYSRINFVLDLEEPYANLQKGYSENITRNIKKATQSGCRPGKGFDVEQVIRLAIGQMKSHSPESKENVERFRRLCKILQEHNQLITYGIFSKDEELLSSAVFLIDNRRAYYILVGNHPAGRNVGASHALIDSFIRDHAGQKLLLDFEGSDIPSLAFFYSSFGAIEQNFAGIKLSRLPFFMKWMKK